MVGKVVHTSATELVCYHEQHLSNGDYHLEEGKVQGEFIGALADEWRLSAEPIFKKDPRSEPSRNRYQFVEREEAAASPKVCMSGD